MTPEDILARPPRVLTQVQREATLPPTIRCLTRINQNQEKQRDNVRTSVWPARRFSTLQTA